MASRGRRSEYRDGSGGGCWSRNMFNDKFHIQYNLHQNISLDESLLQWKGWLEMYQLIPYKAATVGIKTYEICASQTGYL